MPVQQLTAHVEHVLIVDAVEHLWLVVRLSLLSFTLMHCQIEHLWLIFRWSTSPGSAPMHHLIGKLLRLKFNFDFHRWGSSACWFRCQAHRLRSLLRKVPDQVSQRRHFFSASPYSHIQNLYLDMMRSSESRFYHQSLVCNQLLRCWWMDQIERCANLLPYRCFWRVSLLFSSVSSLRGHPILLTNY